MPFIPAGIPEGDIIGWKKVDNKIVKPLIPADAKRSRGTTEECRCEYANVFEIQDVSGRKTKINCVVHRFNDIETMYEVGRIVRAVSWSKDRWDRYEGIHFFIDRLGAVEYRFLIE